MDQQRRQRAAPGIHRAVVGLVVLASAWGWLAFNGPPASACTCATMDQVVGRADTVFTGQFVDPGSKANRFGDVAIEVDDVYAGDVHREQHIVTDGGDACGAFLDEAPRIFAAYRPENSAMTGMPDQPDGVYVVSACTTVTVTEARDHPGLAAALDALGPPRDPLAGASPTAVDSPSTARPTPRQLLAATAIAAVALGAIVVAVRRRRAAAGV